MKLKKIIHFMCVFMLCFCCFLLGAFVSTYNKSITKVTNITENITNTTSNTTANTTNKKTTKKKKKKTSSKKTNWSDTHKYLGTFTITAYNYDEGDGENYQTAGGYKPTPYYTVAVDTNIIPLGTKLYIEDIGVVQAQDTGSAINGYDIDLHIGYDYCNSFGIKHKKVWIIK